MSRARRLTTTSYAILGLLALRSWTTYELTQQMSRSLGRLWPRAESKVYEEPRKLADLGLAQATAERIGRRPRTRYAITPQGRQALRAWLAEPGAGPVLECEQLLQVFFGHQGSRQDTLATLAATRAWAAEQNADNLTAGRTYLAGEGEFQATAAQNMLVGTFLTEWYRMVAQWSDWATEIVEQWPDDPALATPDLEMMARVVRRAEWSEGPEAPWGRRTPRENP